MTGHSVQSASSLLRRTDTAGRRREFPEAFLAGYAGLVHADAYAGYNGVHGRVRHVGCWMHARRAFVEAKVGDPAKADQALSFVRTLYAVERDIAAGGLPTAAVLLSVCASAKRHGLNAWSYLRDLFDRLPARPAGSDLSDLLPDAWVTSHLGR